MPTSLPSDATALTPKWMSGALAERFPGVEVTEVRQIGRSASTNLHLRLGLTYANQAGAPDTLFAKLPPPDPTHRQAIGAAAMGAREANFYSRVAPTISMRVPDTYFARAEPDGSFALLLEDLGVGGIRVSDGTWAAPIELAPRAVEELAELHVRFEDPDLLGAQASWVAPAPPSDRTPMLTKLDEVIHAHADELSPAYVTVGELYVAHHEQLDRIWNAGPQTLVHGDAHVGNLFIDGDRVGFLDWGMTTIGAALKDVSYFITMGVDPDGRPDAELLRHYIDVRASLGGAPMAFDEAWAAHRVIAGYNVMASFLGLTPPYNAPERHLFSSSFRLRAMRSLDDLDTVAAIRSAIG